MRKLVITILFLIGTIAVADSWVPARSIAAVSDNAEWLVRVEPGDSMGDVYGFAGEPDGNFAEATLFKYDKDLEVYSEVKKFETRNPVAPVDVLLSDSGWVVALDNWHNYGIGTVVASYNGDGTLVRELKLADIFSREDLERLDRSVSSIWWRCGPAVLDAFTTTIGVWDTLGREISINYVDGTVEVVGESGFCVDDDQPNTSGGWTDLPFEIQHVGVGSTEQELLDNLGEPISQKQQQPNLGESAYSYDYRGLEVHLTDGVVYGFWLTDGPFKYDNGIAIGMTKVEVGRILGKSYSMENIDLSLGDSDCFANLSFTEKRLSRVFQACNT